MDHSQNVEPTVDELVTELRELTDAELDAAAGGVTGLPVIGDLAS